MNSPKKGGGALGAMSLTSFLVFATIGCWRDCVPVTPLGEDSQKLALGFSGLCPMCQFCLIPFIVANFSHESDSMLSPRSPPTGSLTLGVVLGTLDA